jgi:ATP-dependent Clp protease ATP-binding subunit ClpC
MDAATRMNLSERSKKVVELAGTAATRFGESAISDVHLAIGLLEDAGGVATTAVQFHGIALDRVGEQLVELAELSLPQTVTVDALIATAHAESAAIGHPYVGTEHLLLALLRDKHSPVARLFGQHGFTYEMARARILWILHGDPQSLAPFSAPHDD